jgi:REP element-mobilizing transposase RayT
MSQPLKPRSGPPRNPGVRELVSNKRRYSRSFQREDGIKGFPGWHERGYLPHRDEPGLTQFVTFRLADSFPQSRRSEWEYFRTLEDNRERRKQFEAYLDRGRGECYLRRPEIAKLIEDAFRIFHGRRYELRAWVIMPNHVHVLFKVDATSMSKIVGDWKRFTAKEANKLLNRSGAFWEKDFCDTFIRDAEHETKSRLYIENNPTKARLVLSSNAWPWSSARLRDAYGTLRL